MKKTLIALAALAMASVASAADKPITFTIPTGGNFYGGSFEQDFKIDSGNFAETVLMAYWGNNSSAQNPSANAYFIKAENNLVTITVGRGHFNTYGDITSTWSWYVSDYKTGSFTFAKDDTLLTTYTLKVTGGDQAQQVTVTDCDGVALITFEAYNGNLNGGDNGADTPITAQMNRQFAIPEPTTATLSLLALAGLAARRRRK